MSEIFYYIANDLESEKIAKKVIEDAVMDDLSVGSVYNELCGSLPAIHAESNTYIELKGLTCIKVDYENEVDGNFTRRKITGYSIGYKPAEEIKEPIKREEEKEKKDDTFSSILILSGIFLLGMIFGRKSAPFRPFNPKKDTFVMPRMDKIDMDEVNTVSREDFYKVTDYYNDVFAEAMKENNLYICKGKKRRRK